MTPQSANAKSPPSRLSRGAKVRFMRAAWERLDIGASIAVGFRLLGWTAVTGLATAGLFVVAFAMLGNFTLEGFFAQIGNIADRYARADTARRASFADELWIGSLILLAAVMVLRRGSLAQVFIIDGEK